MSQAVVVDTNVAVVANGQTPQAGVRCVDACTQRLMAIQRSAQVLLDDRGCILNEYRRHLTPVGQLGIGHAFFKWIWDNQSNLARCRRVPVTPHAERGFEEFPDSADLRHFDRDDRKFVAVAAASGEQPPIINASDTDWHINRDVLAKHGFVIEFLCPELMSGDTRLG